MKINPSYRMIAVCGAVMVPLASILVFVSNSGMFVAAVGLLLVLVLVIDAAGVVGSLDSIEVSVPELVRTTRDSETVIEILVSLNGANHRSFFIALELPNSVASEHELLKVDMPDSTERASVDWTCTPGKRGNIRIERGFLGGVSRLGLWEHSRAVALQGEIRVYPNLQQERRNLAAIFMNRDPVGIHRQRSVGRGREFAQLREYLPGDSFEDIHWKASARMGKPVTKLYQVERSQEIYVVIDSSSFSGTRIEGGGEHDGGLTNLERCINAALVLGLVAEKQGDLFGLITFDEQVRTFLKARSGRGHYNSCRDALYAVEPSEHHADFAELFSYIRLNLRKRALLIILTNLSDPLQAERFTENVEIVARNHLILVNVIADPIVQPVFGGDSVSSVNEIYQKLGGHFEWSNMQTMRQRLRVHNISMEMLSHESLSVDLVTQYVTQKQRQLI